MSTALADFEATVRSIELEELEEYRAGKAEAPTLYRPHVIGDKAPKPSDELMNFVASDESVDRMGDIIRAKGWMLGDFRKNPVFLFAHDARSPAIGAVRTVKVEGSELLAGVEWAETTFAQDIKSLYVGGFMRAVSVGFRALDFDFITDKDGGITGIEFKKQELMELSAVPVPANARALRKAMGEGAFALTVPDLTKVFSETRAALEAEREAEEEEILPFAPQPNDEPEPIEAKDLAWVGLVDERLDDLEGRLAKLEGNTEHVEDDGDADGEAEELPPDVAEAIREMAAAVAERQEDTGDA